MFDVNKHCCTSYVYEKAKLKSRFLKRSPTKRASDAGDSGAIPSLFLRLILFPAGRCPAARRAGISHPLISDILNGGKPSLETCTVLAGLFKTPPEQVLRMAGLLPPKAEKDVIKEHADYLMERLSPEKQQQAVEFLEFLVTREEMGEPHGRPNRRPAES